MKKVKIELEGESVFIDGIVAMLAYMQMCGDVGHSMGFEVYVDGDGAFSLANSNLSKLVNHPKMKGADDLMGRMCKADENDEPIRLCFE